MDSALLAQHRVDHAVEVLAVSEVHRERVAAGFVQSGHLRYAAGRAVHRVASAPQFQSGDEPDSGRHAGEEADLVHGHPFASRARRR